MNRQAKSTIKSLVLTLRHKLEDEIAIQLKRYGFAGERWLPVERLPHIQRDDRATSDRCWLETALEQQLRRMGVSSTEAKPKQRAEAVDWFVREIAFTHLNRLAALKCLEVRELIPEIITTREAYGGRSRTHHDYRNIHPAEARGADDALPAAIRHACQRVYAEFKFLFDVGDTSVGRHPPANSILWPSHPVLKECIGLINGLDERAKNTESTLWAEDEIIGWIYQFYNAEHKEAIRKRGKPRRPAEVAVINQFFTPRWIVKFLVDNTLGRLWLEMHPDSERVRQKCDYLVPEPLPSSTADASLASGEGGGRGEGKGFSLDPDSPINNPKAHARREAKRPQEIRLIDPACGTMHFGHYAFEVFQEIYRDARERGWHDLPSPWEGEGSGKGVSEEDIPATILRHNLYGVDIDLRAVQLAGLSMFIKAKTANPRAHISHLNLVVADAVLPADGARQRFLEQYKDDVVVQDAVRQVLDDMANVAEVGSLLRVEEQLRASLAKAGHTAVQGWDRERQRDLPGFEPPTRQLSLADTSGAVPEDWGAHYTLARLLDDLRTFAAEALQTHDLNAELFAQEAQKTMHLLDVFLNDYDVVVMNPPFGTPLDNVKDRLRKSYPAFSNNLLCAFVERALRDFAPAGMVGSVLDRTFLLKMSYERFRREVLLERGRMVTFTDLGWDVLDDANVEVSTIAMRTNGDESDAVFLRAPEGVNLESEAHAPSQMRAFVVSMSDFKSYPNASFAYWTPRSVRAIFRELPSLDPNFGTAKEGIHPNDAKRFLRSHWEVDPRKVGRHKRWVTVANGGSYSAFYRDNQSLILYENEAEAIKSLRGMRNEHLQFREGLTWGKRTDFLSLQYLPEGHAFTHEGHCLFPDDLGVLWIFLALLNSSLMRYTINTLCGQHKTSGYVGQLPYCHPGPMLTEQLNSMARNAHSLKAAWDTGNEICTRFDLPWLIQAHRSTLMAQFPDLHPASKPTSQLVTLIDYVRAVEETTDARLQQLQAQIDEAVYDLYEISPEDRALIERELGDRPPELVWPHMEHKSDTEKRREHVRRLISYFLLLALKEKRDGILPLTTGAGQATALDEVRRSMEAEFGEEAAFRMETEIKQVLGQDMAHWLDGPFIKWHTKLYKKRPIIWQLCSADSRRTFNCFVYYHKLDADALRKVQTLYLWPQRRAIESELERARQDQGDHLSGATARIDHAEAALEALEEFERRLLTVIQGEVECDIPDWAEGPYRGGVYDPVLDDGVKVNITPLQEAGVLRYRKVV